MYNIAEFIIVFQCLTKDLDAYNGQLSRVDIDQFFDVYTDCICEGAAEKQESERNVIVEFSSKMWQVVDNNKKKVNGPER